MKWTLLPLLVAIGAVARFLSAEFRFAGVSRNEQYKREFNEDLVDGDGLTSFHKELKRADGKTLFFAIIVFSNAIAANGDFNSIVEVVDSLLVGKHAAVR